MLKDIVLLGLFLALPFSGFVFILLIREVVVLAQRKVIRQRGVVILRNVDPPTAGGPPQHFVILRHTFEEIRLETRLNTSKRRWKRTTVGKPMRFGFEADFPHTTYVSYWRYAFVRIAKRLLLLAMGIAVSIGCLYTVFWQDSAVV